MKKLFSALLVAFVATSMMAQTGLTCDDPIPVDENYTATVAGPCELWYVANTYDLPLHVYFSPFSDKSTYGPDVAIDFTCTPGKYDDPKIDSLVNTIEDFDIAFPVEFGCDLVVRNGKNEWDLSIDKSYRERMAEFGITYNVRTLVKVTYYEGGTISLKPDELFKNCMETAEVIRLGDTLDILPNDAERVFVVSYSDWQKDSIRFVWIGEESSRVWLAETMCDFEPSLLDPFVWNYFDVAQDQPYKLYPEQMKKDIKEHSGGLFYGKITAPVAGKFVVERIPKNKPLGDAELLEYGKNVSIIANDVNKLYCFPKTWTASEFVAPTAYNVTMYISNQPDFEATDADENVLATYVFNTEDSKKVLYLSTKEIAALKAQAKDDYIYVRFQTAVTTTMVPNPWESLACLEHSVQINPNISQYISANSSSTIYRFRYADFKGYDLTIKWNGNGTLPVYIADTCSFYPSAKDPNVLLYKSIARRGSYVITAAVLEEWAANVGEEGYLYACFDNTVSSRATFKTDKPAAEEPVIPDPVYTTVNDTLCFGEAYDWDGTTYAESGTYEKTYPAANGADSVVTLNLTILPEVPVTVEEVTVNYNETYTWQGKEYTETTNDTVTLENQYGCDSVVVLQLTVLPKPLSACVENSSLINSGDQLTLSLNSAFTIYRIDYNAWVEKGATLTWTGAEPLHMFIAETCTFAVAPYNKYVHVYAPVPAQGEHTINASTMADLAEFVDEDGFLYIRFLTEKEGVLTIE